MAIPKNSKLPMSVVETETHAIENEGAAASGAQSIHRAIAILKLLALGRKSGMRVTDVAKSLSLSRSTVDRILRVLHQEGLAERIGDSARYAIGEQIQLLSLARSEPLHIIKAVEPILRETSFEIGDTAFFNIRTGLDSLCIARSLGSFPIQVLSIGVGDRYPIASINAGISMLSTMSPESSSSIIERDKDRCIPYRISIVDVIARVAEAKATGFAYRKKGIVPGTRAVSVPVMDANGIAIGALTITGINQRITDAKAILIARALDQKARQLEKVLSSKT